MKKTDEILKENGFSLSGTDFKNTNLEKLKKAFDVEGLFFGTLLNYNFRQRGTLVIKEVAGQFWLVGLTKRAEPWQGSLGIVSESLVDMNPALVESEMIHEQNSEIEPIGQEKLPFGNVDMNFSNDFGQRGKYARFEKNPKNMLEWAKSDYCRGPLRARLLEGDIENKIACEVDELIQRVTWTIPVGPGSFKK